MKKSKKPLQTNHLFSILHNMRKKLKLAIMAAAFFGGCVFVSSALADEPISFYQTILTPTTLGSQDSMPFDFSGSDDSPIESSVVFSATPSFSPTPAPEPSTIGLFAAGILLFSVGARIKRGSPLMQTGKSKMP
jgi:hypothetical protein